MKFRQLAYTAFGAGAIALLPIQGVLADDYTPPAEIVAGDMKKLTFHSAPRPVSDVPFQGADGEMTLADYRGQVVVLNFWATWCAPCRAEMPSLDRLQQQRGGDDFQVLTIATGRNAPAAIDKFLAETGIRSLPRLTDPKMALARAFGVLGMPVTVLIDADGQQVARLIGDAEWDSPAALAVIDQLTAN